MTAFRVLVTGSRDWDDAARISDALKGAYYADRPCDAPMIVVHGHCPRGADAIADVVTCTAASFGYWVLPERHPADWDRHGKAAGFIRNQEMVDAGADLCLAFIKNGSRGATDCAARAEKAGITTWRFEL